MPSLVGTLPGLGLVSPRKGRLSGVSVETQWVPGSMPEPIPQRSCSPTAVILTPTITFVVTTVSL